jgi:hypothetical protein
MTELWQQAREIGECWGLVTPEHALSESEIAAAETRLGFRLPSILREWYLWSGNMKTFSGSGDWLLPPSQLQVLFDHLIFSSERDGTHAYGVALTELEKPDPLLMITNDFYIWYDPDDPEDCPDDGLEDCWYPPSEGTLSAFFRDKLLEGALEQCPFGGCVILSEEARVQVCQAYSAVEPAVTWPLNFGKEIYQGKGIFIASMESAFVERTGSSPERVAVSALSEEALKQFCDVAGITEVPSWLAWGAKE